MSIYPIILKQTKFTHYDNLKYPFEERGLQFGDGVYEVIRIYNGKYYLLEEHVDRLFRSASAIKIKLPFDKAEFTHLLNELLIRNKMNKDGKVYLQITRGSAPRDHIFPVDVLPNIYAYLQDLPRNLQFLSDGVHAITAKDIRWQNCYIKSLNLLPNVLAKQEAKEHGCYEAILHRDGKVTECSSSNVYMVRNGKIYTHPATDNILHGCVRMAIERFADEMDIPFIEDAFKVEDIQLADEIFLSSSTSEIMPVVKVDDQTISGGKAGEITRRLQTAYEKDAGIKENMISESVS